MKSNGSEAQNSAVVGVEVGMVSCEWFVAATKPSLQPYMHYSFFACALTGVTWDAQKWYILV